MRSILKFLVWLFGATGAILMFAAQVSPEQATSSLAAWAKYLDIRNVPNFLLSQEADKWTTLVGIGLIFSALFIFINGKSSKKRPIKNINHKSENAIYEDHFNDFVELSENPDNPSIKPDMDINDAMDYVLRVINPSFNPDDIDVNEDYKPVSNLLTEKFRSGQLKSWGRYENDSIERALGSGDWQYRELHPMKAHIAYSDRAITVMVGPKEKQPSIGLTAVRVNSNQLQKIWPNRIHEITKPVSDKHNVSLLEAIHYVATHKWDNVRVMLRHGEVLISDEDINQIEAAWNTVRQHAIDGDIRIWGDDSKGHYILIDNPSYWKTHWINWTQILGADEINDWGLDEQLGASLNDDLYHTYRTSKQDIERLWP